MDLYNFDNKPQKKPLNKKKILKITAIISIVIAIIVLIILYVKLPSVRNFFDTYIFQKEVYENNLDKISLTEDDSHHVYAFQKNILILSKNNLDVYNSSGKKERSLNVELSNPIFCAKNKYFVLAENKGNKLYLISDNNIVWQQNVDGNITNITVNKNGYVSVVMNDTSYKTVVETYDTTGIPLFKVVLASTYAIDVSISEDDKYLAIAETNFSGTLIQSKIEVFSIDNHSKLDTYSAETDKLIINIEYQEKNKLVCMYDDCIHIIENGQDREFMSYDYKNTLFFDINFDSYVARIEKTSSGPLSSNSEIKFTNVNNNSTNSYELGGFPKSICSYKDITAVNLGSEAIFVRTNGWLAKKYKANQEIQNIVLSNNLAGIVYKDKVEIVKF